MADPKANVFRNPPCLCLFLGLFFIRVADGYWGDEPIQRFRLDSFEEDKVRPDS